MCSDKRFQCLSAFLFIIIVSGSIQVLAQNGYTIEGRVLTQDLRPPTFRVNVSLILQGAMISETTTDVEGHYFFSNLGQAVYQLIAHGDGEYFGDSTVTVEVSSLNGVSRVFSQDIQLRPKPQSREAAPGTISAQENDKTIPEKARKDYKSGVK
ncbi:MAG: hypothetical protein ACREDR_31080, partial [Blastocatellia bacterium]